MVETLFLTEQDRNSARQPIRKELEFRKHYHDTEYAFTMSVKAAMKDRPKGCPVRHVIRTATDARQEHVPEGQEFRIRRV
jgi:hypothetical protein